MVKGVTASFTQLSAPLRRLRVTALAHYLIIAIGLVAMSAFTVPEVRNSAGLWLSVLLWGCLGYFAIEVAAGARAAWRAGTVASHLVSASSLIDLLTIMPVPIALACGVPAPTAWLFACLWVLKLAQNLPGFAQLARVFVLEAKALASVLVLFLIALFLAAAIMHLLERTDQPLAFGTLPASLWWAVVTLTTTGYGDEVPHSTLGHVLGAVVMMCGIATFGLWTGILATGFAAESRRRNFIQTWDLVSKVPFFQSLDPAGFTELAHMLRRVEIPARMPVIRRGRVGDCMYFIAEGEVEVEISPTPVRLGAGAFFGELALLGDSIRTANVSTSKASTLLILDLVDFRTFVAHHPELGRIIDGEGKRRVSENLRRRELHARGGASS
jgi:voltage-gated potassium channel